MKMSDHMKLPVSDRFTPDFDDVLWPIIAHAINQHDPLVSALREIVQVIDDETGCEDDVSMAMRSALWDARKVLASEDCE